jgi:Domain of unknown function (DUF4383)
MIRTLGTISGLLFLLGGILGFVPGITDGDMFLGIFMVNTVHSIMHIASGAIFLIASIAGAGPTRLWFLVFGVFYAALAAMGFRVGDGMILNVISNNRNDSWGHAGLALILLLVGFFAARQTASGSKRATQG